MSVTLTITDGPSFPGISWSSGMTGRDVLEAAYNSLVGDPPEPVTEFAYNLEFYGSVQTPPLGYLVNMINGTFDSFNTAQAPYFFWEFQVGETIPETGIDYTTIPDNTVVTFSYIQYVPETASKQLHAKYQRRLAFAK